MSYQKSQGFTLAELLISLAILGVIATFTIPKILDSSSTSKTSSIAKEAASMISGAYSTYKLNNTPATTTSAGDFTSFMNYVKTDTATDAAPATGEFNMDACTSTKACLQLHNGAVLQYDTAVTFGSGASTTSTNAIPFNVDPDGTKTAAGGVTFWQFFNGRLTTGANADPTTTQVTYGGTKTAATTTTDPSWLTSWN